MLCDHIGAMFFPDIVLLRVVGRLSFPMFAYMLSEGYVRTRNKVNYTFRLLVFSILSQIPFMLALNCNELNIGFTLLFGFVCMMIYEKDGSILKIILVLVASELLNVDYGSYGVLFILCCHIHHQDMNRLALDSIAAIPLLFVAQTAHAMFGGGHSFFTIVSGCVVQLFSVLSIPLISAYDGQKGKMYGRYWFYAFYPLHLLVLFIINTLH